MTSSALALQLSIKPTHFIGAVALRASGQWVSSHYQYFPAVRHDIAISLILQYYWVIQMKGVVPMLREPSLP